MLEFGSGHVIDRNKTFTKNYINNYVVNFNPNTEDYVLNNETVQAHYFNMTVDWVARIGWSNFTIGNYSETAQYFGDGTVNVTTYYPNGTIAVEFIDFGSIIFLFEGYFAPSVFRVVEFRFSDTDGLGLDGIGLDSFFPDKQLLDYDLGIETSETNTDPTETPTVVSSTDSVDTIPPTDTPETSDNIAVVTFTATESETTYQAFMGVLVVAVFVGLRIQWMRRISSKS